MTLLLPCRRTVLFGASAMLMPRAVSAAPLPFQPVLRRTPDMTLLTHRRETLRWVSDIVRAPRKSFIGLTFLGCESQCPPSDLLFQQLDQQAGAAIDLYTLTLDPADDWRRLRVKAEQMGSSPRWRFLTGEASPVYALLDSLDVAYGDINQHGQMILRAGSGRLDRLNSLPDGPAPLLEGL